MRRVIVLCVFLVSCQAPPEYSRPAKFDPSHVIKISDTIRNDYGLFRICDGTTAVYINSSHGSISAVANSPECMKNQPNGESNI